MKNVLLVAQHEGEDTKNESTPNTGQIDQGTRQRLNTGGYTTSIV